MLGSAIPTDSFADTSVNLRKNPSTTGPVPSGQTFRYNLAWSCPGAVTPVDDCIDMRIVEALPPELQATELPEPGGKLRKVCVQNPGDPVPDPETCAPASVSLDAPTQPGATVHFFAVPRIRAGDAGSLRVETRFPVGVTPDGTEAVNQATITASCNADARPGCTDPAPVTATSPPVTASAEDKVSVTKRVLSDAAIGFDLVYRIRICPGEGNGYENPGDLVVTDRLPAEATFVSADPAPDSQDGTELGWVFAGQLTECRDIDITVRYDADRNNAGDSRRNRVDLDYTPLQGSPPLPRTVGVTHVLSDPGPGLRFFKSANDDVVNVGQEFNYFMRATNNGNVPLGVRLTDSVPGLCRVTRFVKQSDATACEVTLSDDSIVDCFGAGDTVGESDVGANGSDLFIKTIRVDYGDADNAIVGVDDSRTLNIRCRVMSPGWDGTEYSMPATVTNTATVEGANGPVAIEDDASADVTLRDAVANPTVQPGAEKSQTAGGVVRPGNDIAFRIDMTNSDAYSSPPEQVPLAGPVFADLLLPGMHFVSSDPVGSPPADCTDMPAVRVIEDYNATERTLVVWDWSGTGCTLQRGDVVSYDLVATIGDVTLAGRQSNEVAFLGSDNPPEVARATEVCDDAAGAGFLDDLVTGATLDAANGVGDEARVCQAASAPFRVQRITDISSEKAVTATREPPDTWLLGSDEPNNVARSIREGNVRWQLRVSNTANIPVDAIELIDIVPASPDANPPGTGGNTGVGTGRGLGSRWTPVFVREIDLSGTPAGTNVFYTQAPNPCRDNIVAVPDCNPMTTLADGTALTDETAVPAPGEPGEWTTELPNDPDRVRAFRIVYPEDYQIPPGETLLFEFPMFIKADAPVSDCVDIADSACSEIAWNTFGFSYREADSGLENQSAPTRVGVIVQDSPPGSAGLGDYVWFDTDEDGIQDPGEVNNGINNVLVELWRDPDGVPDNGDELLLGEQRTTNHPDTGLPGYYHFGLFPPTPG
ncbi:MAG: hypothetical protein K9L70_13150, partial [Thiohalocapsa sp.]|nr:hypothetical protein [Thiohalocapsa sp.]